MALTLGTTGMDGKTEAEVQSAFKAANAETGNQWTLVDGDDADYVVVDMDSLYGPMSWLRLHAAGRKVIGLTSVDRNQTDYRLPRPVSANDFTVLLSEIAVDAPFEAAAAKAAAAAAAPVPAPAPKSNRSPPRSKPPRHPLRSRNQNQLPNRCLLRNPNPSRCRNRHRNPSRKPSSNCPRIAAWHDGCWQAGWNAASACNAATARSCWSTRAPGCGTARPR